MKIEFINFKTSRARVELEKLSLFARRLRPSVSGLTATAMRFVVFTEHFQNNFARLSIAAETTVTGEGGANFETMQSVRFNAAMVKNTGRKRVIAIKYIRLGAS